MKGRFLKDSFCFKKKQLFKKDKYFYTNYFSMKILKINFFKIEIDNYNFNLSFKIIFKSKFSSIFVKNISLLKIRRKYCFDSILFYNKIKILVFQKKFKLEALKNNLKIIISFNFLSRGFSTNFGDL